MHEIPCKINIPHASYSDFSLVTFSIYLLGRGRHGQSYSDNVVLWKVLWKFVTNGSDKYPGKRRLYSLIACASPQKASSPPALFCTRSSLVPSRAGSTTFGAGVFTPTNCRDSFPDELLSTSKTNDED